MRILLFVLPLLTTSFLIPIPTNMERCMVVYSTKTDDTIKISVKFPQDSSIENHYNYQVNVKDLNGQSVVNQTVENSVFRSEVLVPNRIFCVIF